MNFEDREKLKEKILVLASKEPFPLTVPKVMEELNVTYPTAQGLLLEMVIEGSLLLERLGWTRMFILNREKFLPKRAVVLKEGE